MSMKAIRFISGLLDVEVAPGVPLQDAPGHYDEIGLGLERKGEVFAVYICPVVLASSGAYRRYTPVELFMLVQQYPLFLGEADAGGLSLGTRQKLLVFERPQHGEVLVQILVQLATRLLEDRLFDGSARAEGIMMQAQQGRMELWIHPTRLFETLRRRECCAPELGIPETVAEFRWALKRHPAIEARPGGWLAVPAKHAKKAAPVDVSERECLAFEQAVLDLRVRDGRRLRDAPGPYPDLGLILGADANGAWLVIEPRRFYSAFRACLRPVGPVTAQDFGLNELHGLLQSHPGAAGATTTASMLAGSFVEHPADWHTIKLDRDWLNWASPPQVHG